MDIQYQWGLLKLIEPSKTNKDYRVKVDWIKTGTDERGIEGYYMGRSMFEVKEDDEDYVSFNKLSDLMILEKLISNLSEEEREKINSDIENQIISA